MVDIFLNMLWSILDLLKPVVILIAVIVVIAYCLFGFWYCYFYFKEGKRIQKNSEGSSDKRLPLWRVLLIEVPRRYVLDLFERPADYFDLCGLHIFCGEQSSGKTMSMVELILRIQKKYPKCKTITNFGLITETTALKHWKMLINYVNGFYGVVVGIDEIQNWFMSGHNQLPPEMLEVVTQNRKNRRIIVCSAQVFIDVHKKIRQQVSMVYEPHTYFGCFTFVVMYKPRFDSEGYVKERKYRGAYCFVHTEELRNAYDTYRCIHMLAKEGFKESELST